MPPKNNSLLDNDFLDEGDLPDIRTPDKEDKEPEGRFFFDDEGTADKVSGFPDPKEIDLSKDKPEIEVVVKDDTPDKDKGKWIADPAKDGDPDTVPDDEAKQYSDKVRERISKLTARQHAERRAAENFARERDEAVKLAKRLIAENNQLKEVVEGGEKVLMGEHKARLEGALAQAKAQYREATEAGDTNGVIAAQENMAKAIAQMERLSAHRPQVLPREKEDIEFTPVQQQKPQATEGAAAWQEKNPWFGAEGYEPMTNMALGLHQTMVREGVTPDTKEYYGRIDKEIRQRFPERFKSSAGNGQGNGQQQPQRRAIVAAPTRQSGNGQRKVVQLTESQVRLARRLGLTPQQYAEQVAAEESSDGKNFTF
jgi:hypothetical protein